MVNVKLLSSPTCVPCTVVAKRLEKANIKFEKINALEHPEYDIAGTPHIIVEKDGTIIKNEHVNMGSINSLIDELKEIM